MKGACAGGALRRHLFPSSSVNINSDQRDSSFIILRFGSNPISAITLMLLQTVRSYLCSVKTPQLPSVTAHDGTRSP
jgi:hypothetical protein